MPLIAKRCKMHLITKREKGSIHQSPANKTRSSPRISHVSIDSVDQLVDELLEYVAQLAASTERRRLGHALREYGNEREILRACAESE
ncbi:dissimilatory sulfite reductase (desulfoviridin) alpha/beta subunit [Bradyrhizobium sp. USDA 4461]